MTTRTRSVSRTRQERQPLDLYCTPLALALALCSWLKQRGIGVAWNDGSFRILEPSAGHGDFVTAARSTWPNATIIANEIQPKLVPKPVMREYLLACAAAKKAKQPRPPEPEPTLDTSVVLRDAGADIVVIGDFLQLVVEKPFYCIPMNPPYSLGGGAAAHTAKAISLLAPGGVCAVLAKMHFRGTADRIPFWKEHREMLAADPPVVPRPDFTGDGRDTVEYSFFCWHRSEEHQGRWREWCAPAIEWAK